MKRFNTTGTCISDKHYMVDNSNKIDKIINYLIKDGEYFTINRPRQYGKTTTMYFLDKKLKDDYLLIFISFEGLGDEAFENAESLSTVFLNLLKRELKIKKEKKIVKLIEENSGIKNFEKLDEFLTDLILEVDRKVILMIDEVDKSSNNQLFLNFIGMLRDKYLRKNMGRDYTFHSIILAGVHDVKNMKLKLRPNAEKQYNSPWNIAVDFDIDMSFNVDEIKTMLVDYEKENQTGMDIDTISNNLRKFTSGYPFLVSKLCKIIDEKLNKKFTSKNLEIAINILIETPNTLFDDLIKNIENNSNLYLMVENIIIKNETIDFVHTDNIISLGAMYGIFRKNENKKVKIDNKVFEILLYNHIISKLNRTEGSFSKYNYRDNFIDKDGHLEMEKILRKFQQFIKENYSNKDESFYEKQGRLLLLAFIKPIINGTGFYYVENQISYEKRLDMVITYNNREYIVEFKIWYGLEYHKKGLIQLEEYLDIKKLTTGYLVVFNFNKNKKCEAKWVEQGDKKIFEVEV